MYDLSVVGSKVDEGPQYILVIYPVDKQTQWINKGDIKERKKEKKEKGTINNTTVNDLRTPQTIYLI